MNRDNHRAARLLVAVGVSFGVSIWGWGWGCAGNPASTLNGAPPGGGSSGGSGSGSGSGSGGGPTGSLPCDVDRILGSHCRTCHANPPLFGAPMPLVTLADLHAPTHSAPSVPVYTTAGARSHDDTKPMPPQPNARLSAADQATLDAWIAQSAPAAGDPNTCSPGAATDAGGQSDADPPPPTDCVFDTHVAPSVPFKMGSGELYACYGFDIPTAGKRHVTEIKIHLDNKAIVHHVLLLESASSVAGTPPGVPAACNAGSAVAPMMYAWAPGGNPLITPAEAGFPQDQNTHYLVQIHYNNAANLPGPVDSTGFDLCTTANLRKYDADVLAFGTQTINVPALGSATATSCFTVDAQLTGRTFFSAFPHMHKLGTTISTALHPADGGAPIDMGAIAHWQFSDQPWLPISAVANTGDVIRASCSWNNPGNTPVGFGQNTTDEMCYSFTAYYPKAPSSIIGWLGPATLSGPCP